jgi:hypothetical protein
MGRIEKTVFISYRRTDESWALAIFQDLTQHGYDVFIDYDGIASGNFEIAILENITERRPHPLPPRSHPHRGSRGARRDRLRVLHNRMALTLGDRQFGVAVGRHKVVRER